MPLYSLIAEDRRATLFAKLDSLTKVPKHVGCRIHKFCAFGRMEDFRYTPNMVVMPMSGNHEFDLGGHVYS